MEQKCVREGGRLEQWGGNKKREPRIHWGDSKVRLRMGHGDLNQF